MGKDPEQSRKGFKNRKARVRLAGEEVKERAGEKIDL